MNIREQLIAAGLWDALDLRDPAQEISAAWQVVEKMRLEGNQVQVWGNSGENVWRASLKAEFGHWGEYFTKAESAPMVICLAALKAIGVEIK